MTTIAPRLFGIAAGHYCADARDATLATAQMVCGMLVEADVTETELLPPMTLLETLLVSEYLPGEPCRLASLWHFASQSMAAAPALNVDGALVCSPRSQRPREAEFWRPHSWATCAGVVPSR